MSGSAAGAIIAINSARHQQATAEEASRARGDDASQRLRSEQEMAGYVAKYEKRTSEEKKEVFVSHEQLAQGYVGAFVFILVLALVVYLFVTSVTNKNKQK